MLNPDYKEMLSLLLEEEVEFVLVGAYALAVHGFPRATGDMDVFVNPIVNKESTGRPRDRQDAEDLRNLG